MSLLTSPCGTEVEDLVWVRLWILPRARERGFSDVVVVERERVAEAFFAALVVDDDDLYVLAVDAEVEETLRDEPRDLQKSRELASK